jgi:hypothetical protein
MTTTASDVLVETLSAWGIDTIFGIPGDGINGIMEALRKRTDSIRFIQVRHEEAAAFMITGLQFHDRCLRRYRSEFASPGSRAGAVEMLLLMGFIEASRPPPFSDVRYWEVFLRLHSGSSQISA